MTALAASALTFVASTPSAFADGSTGTSSNIVANPTTAGVNTPVTFTYTITANNDNNSAWGPVTWNITGGSSNPTCSISNANGYSGSASSICTVSFTNPGSYTVSATYNGTVDVRGGDNSDSNGDIQSGGNGDDSHGDGSASATITYQVTSAPNPGPGSCSSVSSHDDNGNQGNQDDQGNYGNGGSGTNDGDNDGDDSSNCPAPMTTVTFNGNGATTGTMSAQSANAPTALTLDAFTRTGYSFTGWNTASNGTGHSYANGAIYPFTASVTLYAQWQLNNYTVTFIPNYPGNPGTPVTEGCSLGSTVTFPPAPTLSGYTFLGWFTASSGGSAVTSQTCGNVTLYAQWQLNSSLDTVVFDPTGGTVTPTYETCSPGNLLSSLPTPSRSNYLFDGWFTAASGGSLVTSSYCFSGTLYAQWTASNNGGGTFPLPTPTVGISNLPSNPEKGSNFTPIYVTDGNGTVFTASSNTPSVCTVNSASTLITFVTAGTCSLVVHVAATSTWNAGTGTVTTQATNASPGNPHQRKLTVRQLGSGSVNSNIGSIVLHAPGTRSRNFNNGTKVILRATPKAGYVTHWSQACHGSAKTCSVTVNRAMNVTVSFVPELNLPAFYFGTNLSNVTASPATVAAFKKDLVRLSKSHVKVLNVRGFADYRNGPAYNLALSQRRASSVAAFIDSLFTQLGIAPMPIKDLGLGILRASQNLQLDRKAIVTF